MRRFVKALVKIAVFLLVTIPSVSGAQNTNPESATEFVFNPMREENASTLEKALETRTKAFFNEPLESYTLSIQKHKAELTLTTATGTTVLRLSIAQKDSPVLRAECLADRTSRPEANAIDWDAFVTNLPLSFHAISSRNSTLASLPHDSSSLSSSESHAPAWGALCAVLFVYLMVALAFAAPGHSSERSTRNRGWRRLSVFALLAVAAWFVGALKLLPVSWITPIHVVGWAEIPDMVLGKAVHCGVCWNSLIHLAPEGVAPLRIVVAANLFFAFVNVALLFGFCRRRSYSIPEAAFFTALIATFPSFRIPAFSEFPSQFAMFLTFSGAALVEACPPARARSIRLFSFGFSGLLAVTLLAWFTRQELAVLGGLALVIYAFAYLCGEERIEKARGKIRDIFARKPRALAWVLLVIVAVLAAFLAYEIVVKHVAIPSIETHFRASQAAWLIEALNAFSLFSSGPWERVGESLKAVFLVIPPGFGVLAALGAVGALLRWERWLLQPISCLFLVTLYFNAGHRQTHDLLRLLGMLLGAFTLFGLHGVGMLERALRRFGPRTARWSALAVLGLFVAIDYPSWRELLETPREVSESIAPYENGGWTLDSDNQIMVRTMLDVAERHPGCTFLQTAWPVGEKSGTPRIRQMWNLREKTVRTAKMNGNDLPTVNKDHCLIYVQTAEAAPETPTRWSSNCLKLLDELDFRARPYKGGQRISMPPLHQGTSHRLATYEVDTSREECLGLSESN